tara:strand:+ start:633 stop:872 length:240 start_codon:yes stop_codon:yes gene_type:complete
MEGYMFARKVTHEIKLPLSLTTILGVIAFGLIANVFKPILQIDEALASNPVHKIAICNPGEDCAKVTENGILYIQQWGY